MTYPSTYMMCNYPYKHTCIYNGYIVLDLFVWESTDEYIFFPFYELNWYAKLDCRVIYTTYVNIINSVILWLDMSKQDWTTYLIFGDPMARHVVSEPCISHICVGTYRN